MGQQYVDKAAVVAEIKRRMNEYNTPIDRLGSNNIRLHECKDILSFLDTLELKEVDLDTLGVLAEHLLACYAHGVSPNYNERELDLLTKMKNNKEQKGE